MTYKEIVDRIKDIVERHKMLHDFGYGNLSDIKANNEGNESADYPYAFLNPTNHTRSGQAITYRFNLIVMDMVLDQDYLKIQSECQQYIDDILGNLRFGYTDQVDLTLNVSLTPFKERFQDVVAGMTATLEVVIPQKLSDCYEVVAPTRQEVIAVYTNVPESGDQFHESLMRVRDLVNFPQYDSQYQDYGIWFHIEGEYNYGNRVAPSVVNPDAYTENGVNWQYGNRELVFPEGVGGSYVIRFEFDLTNVQGLDPNDIINNSDIRIRVNGDVSTFDFPALPADGTIVPFEQELLVNTEDYNEDRVTVDWTLVPTSGFSFPDGPIIGYRGSMKVYKLA